MDSIMYLIKIKYIEKVEYRKPNYLVQFFFLPVTQSYSKYATDKGNSEFGAVFNLEFSPYGNILAAACEKKTILLYDAKANERFTVIHNAHLEAVNTLKFLNNDCFASCSDDNTVALWDMRNLNRKLRSLQGHCNWVKSVEYSNNVLVSAGFDGSVFQWDLTSQTENGLIYQKIFHTSGLTRCRITPDGNKMIICTTGGYIIVIHDLNLNTLHKDLVGFRPNIYRLMQLGRQFIPHAAKFDHVFSKKTERNRVELISDFPAENDAEVICSLQVSLFTSNSSNLDSCKSSF